VPPAHEPHGPHHRARRRGRGRREVARSIMLRTSVLPVHARLAGLLAVAALVAVPGTAAARRQAPPPGGTPRPFVLPEATRFSLPNGMAVTIVPYGTVPKVNVSLVVRMGNADESADEVWLADLTGALMREG